MGEFPSQIADERSSLKDKGKFNAKGNLKIVWELDGDEYFSIGGADKMLTLSL